MTDLTYRDLGPTDFDVLHDMARRWAVVRQLGGWPWPADPAFTKSRCKPYTGKGFVWGIICGDQLCGSVAVTNGELGYMLHPDFSGQGIMTRAARAALTHARATSDIAHFQASVWHDNPASKAVVSKLGFQHWQTRFEPSFARRIPTLSHYYRLSRADWDILSKAQQ